MARLAPYPRGAGDAQQTRRSAGPEGNLMRHAPGTDVWHWTIRLRADWRGTYDLFEDAGGGPESGGPAYWQWLRGQHRADPNNPRNLPRRWGGEPVAYAELPHAPGRWTGNRGLMCLGAP
nr:enterochelin esterase domain-containing protein [Streptomyces avermitilis]